MKKYSLFIALFLLTGCPGPGDRMVASEHATAIIKDNQVCVISPLQPSERITAVQIYSHKSSLLINFFDDKPIYVTKGQCLPLFNLIPQPGLYYFIYWNISAPKVADHLVESSFSVSVDSAGQLQIH
ncbi:hypothetical protein PT300_10145 [Enterobacteriaceae bacterium ESL0689]|nr:hypothetical protein [Enterobacteriaceae bacterium ESL0689]